MAAQLPCPDPGTESTNWKVKSEDVGKEEASEH